MKFSIFTVICFSAFFVGPHNAHEKPYVAEAIDPMEHWLSHLEKNAVEAGAFGAFTGNVTRLETIVKLACSTGYISYLNSSHFQTLAECAVFAGSPDILQLLFDCGLKFNEDLLFDVITNELVKNKADLVETLFENGGTINLDDDRKFSLLKFAFSFGEIGVMEMLLTNGIDVNVRLSGDNNTLLHYICLTSLGFKRINSRYLTINDKDYNMRNVPFELLLSIGADINAINMRGSTPIHFCATSRHLMAAKMLVDAGADVNIQSNKGYTPLFLAFASFVYDGDSQGSAEMIKLLVQNGAVLKENQFYDGIRNDRAFQKYI